MATAIPLLPPPTLAIHDADLAEACILTFKYLEVGERLKEL